MAELQNIINALEEIVCNESIESTSIAQLIEYLRDEKERRKVLREARSKAYRSRGQGMCADDMPDPRPIFPSGF